MNNQKYLALLVLLLPVAVAFTSPEGKESSKLNTKVETRIRQWKNPLPEFNYIARTRIDSIRLNSQTGNINVFFNPVLSYIPVREDIIPRLRQSVVAALGRRFRGYEISMFCNGVKVEELIPNIFRQNYPKDNTRIPSVQTERPVLLRREEIPAYPGGLSEKNIALWHSHGYFYEASLDRWEWQRAKLFGTVEDISVMAYVLPFLTPMLERSGAYVLLPRERDFQSKEIIVDNDKSTAGSEVVLHLAKDSMITGKGFLLKDTLFTNDNPFRMGTALKIKNDSAVFLPSFTEDGEYAVSVSWPSSPDNSSDVRYIIRHAGGKTIFHADQTIGGGTWIYLGTFRFRSGRDFAKGSVTVMDGEGKGKYIGIDAVRFGGGMGNVARRPSASLVANRKSVAENGPVQKTEKADTVSYSWKISGKPRFNEGARYWLQYAGMPDSLVYTPNTNRNDYNDDYQSRGIWVNYLMSAPGNDAGKSSGLGIPIDLSFAFHTDAGITPNDSIVGSLVIYSTASENGKYPNGTSRIAARDIADMVQTQIVNDLRRQYNPEWVRRAIWDKPYSEAKRPNVPAVLLELLSHQNQADQVYGLDPRFRFAVSRAVYKAILKYFCFTENRPYIVQPLPVNNFAIKSRDGSAITLSWTPVIDTLEPTSVPLVYKVYTRKGDGGFDNGVTIKGTSIDMNLDTRDLVYSFKVTALNDGGESFDSEILSAGISSIEKGRVLVVNAFDRISGPAWFDTGGMAGVEWWNDRGVPYKYDISGIGDQYDFDRKSPWLDDDAAGWGSSYSDREGMVIAGNSFDYPAIHGSAVLKAGYSFVSVSDEYFVSPGQTTKGLSAVDIICGEEKSIPSFLNRNKMDFSIYSPSMIKKLEDISTEGTGIIITGSYVGTDLTLAVKDSSAIKFASRVLHFSHRTGHAVNTGELYSTDAAGGFLKIRSGFNTAFAKGIYQAEAPDAIEPSGKNAITAIRYTQNNTSAAIAYSGRNRIFIAGFPFETVYREEDRDNLMKQILQFISK
ncbi:MAG: xanthan lyase [Bacteroidales bacterium]